MTYSPFASTTTAQLSAAHLAVLADVPEGWFIEYKREPCKPKDYAKEASAFANSRGGWIFVGLAEDPSTRKPSGGPGLPKIEAQRQLDAARDAIAQNLSPSPYVELKIVDGPIPELAIPDDRSVLVVRIPESQNTPHIHASGRVYRRQVDVADPVPITDRAELDQLFERKKRLHEFTDEQLNVGFDERWAADFATPWIHLAVVPDPAQPIKSKQIEFERFRQIIHSTSAHSVGLPDVYASALGYVARNHRIQEAVHGPATTLEYAHGGALYITLPLSTGPLTRSENPPFLRGRAGMRFIRVLRNQAFDETQLIDGTHLAAAIDGLGKHTRELLKELDARCSYFYRIQLRNVFRSIPFFESEAYVDWCEANTIPVMHRGNHQIPWHSKRWLKLTDIQKENAFIGPLIFILSTMGIGGDAMGEIVVDCINATVKSRNAQ